MYYQICGITKYADKKKSAKERKLFVKQTLGSVNRKALKSGQDLYNKCIK